MISSTGSMNCAGLVRALGAVFLRRREAQLFLDSTDRNVLESGHLDLEF